MKAEIILNSYLLPKSAILYEIFWKELDFKNEENEIEVLNEQVKNGDLDYAMKTELFENMQKENLQLNQDSPLI